MDGMMLGKSIKADEALKETRLIMMTSMGMIGQAKVLEEIGFSAYLVKPVKHKDLMDCLLLSVDQSGLSSPGRLITRHSVREIKKRNVRILLAEDDFTNQQVAVGILEKLGFPNVTVVDNGIEAVEAALKDGYDIILMDVQMPELDGLAAARKIRATEKGAQRIPIIAMTAHAMQSDRERCLKAGMDDYLTKPVNGPILAKTIEKWFPEDSQHSHVSQSFLPKEEDNNFLLKESSTQEAHTIFDQENFKERLMGDQQLAQKIINGFLEDMPRQINQLKKVVMKKDIDASAYQAHKIKGAAGNICGDAFREIAYQMEKAGKNRDMDAIETLMPILEKKYNQLAKAIREMKV
jgi:CheY-like chemotaxis protein/HPt (histidine-containing phosphotransfer) domain-containing protein